MYKKLIYLTCLSMVLGLALTNVSSAVPADLLGWWKLDDGSGTVAKDSSGKGNDGTVNDPTGGLGPGGSVWVDDPERGTVASFAGAAYISTPVILPEMTLENDFSWAFWAKQDASETSTNTTIVGNRSGTLGGGTQFIKFTPSSMEYYNGGQVGQLTYSSAIGSDAGTWHHHVVVKDGASLSYYRDGVLDVTTTATGTVAANPFYIGGDGVQPELWNGYLSDVQLWNKALTASEVLTVRDGLAVGEASKPFPADKAIEVPRSVMLSWEPGEYAGSHNVYFGTDFDDVNDATVDNVTRQQTGISYNPGELEWGTTYYWRVDEVNRPPTSDAVFKGKTWSFTTELYSVPIEGQYITATASSAFDADMGPEKTIDGSGLTSVSHPIDTRDDVHSIDILSMWLSGEEDAGPVSIQYDLDKPYQLDKMLVWNFNGELYLPMLGMKDVTVEYSTDGETWMPFNATEFARATGQNDNPANMVIAFNDLEVKSVRLTAASNWSGGIFSVSGLSEVDFLKIPSDASDPDPANGATGVALDPVLSWVVGRGAVDNTVYFSSDEQAVEDGTALVGTFDQTSYATSETDIDQTYYWRVDQTDGSANVWTGSTWSFTTVEYLVVDDFEGYANNTDDLDPNQVYYTYTDGFMNAANGSTIGYLEGDPMETDDVHGGAQAVPLLYDNTVAMVSEVTVNPADLAVGSDWSERGAQVLVLWFLPDENVGVTDQIYVKVGNTKVVYDGEIVADEWNQWNIDLSNHSNVTQFAIGLEPIGAVGSTGQVLLDDIRLYKVAPVEVAE